MVAPCSVNAATVWATLSIPMSRLHRPPWQQDLHISRVTRRDSRWHSQVANRPHLPLQCTSSTIASTHARCSIPSFSNSQDALYHGPRALLVTPNNQQRATVFCPSWRHQDQPLCMHTIFPVGGTTAATADVRRHHTWISITSTSPANHSMIG
jgi:hypothetical protein